MIVFLRPAALLDLDRKVEDRYAPLQAEKKKVNIRRGMNQIETVKESKK